MPELIPVAVEGWVDYLPFPAVLDALNRFRLLGDPVVEILVPHTLKFDEDDFVCDIDFHLEESEWGEYVAAHHESGRSLCLAEF